MGVVVAVWLLCACSAYLHAQGRPTDSQVKAAYLYNFGKFVRWRDGGNASDSQFTICVTGKDPFDGALQSAANGESIGGKPVVVKKLGDRSSVNGCRVLYLSSTEIRRLTTPEDLRHAPILTVSDAPDFLRQGGIIQFVTINDRIRFEVSLPAAQAAGIQLSSELLKVALRVMGADHASSQEPPR